MKPPSEAYLEGYEAYHARIHWQNNPYRFHAHEASLCFEWQMGHEAARYAEEMEEFSCKRAGKAVT